MREVTRRASGGSRSDRRPRVPSLWLAAGLVVVTRALGMVAGAAPPADQHDATGSALTVMSFNIRYGTAADGENAWPMRRERVFELIRSNAPDLLGTQETLAFQRDELAAALSGYGVVSAGRDDGQEAGEMAALFYREARFERIDAGHFWLSAAPEQVGSVGWDAALPRIASWVRLRDRRQPESRDILFLNTHFDHRGATARLESARLIRRWLAEHADGCRLVVTGDFNAAEGSEPYHALFGEPTKGGDPADGDTQAARLMDTLRAVHPRSVEPEGTFTGFDATRIDGPRIDWIGCSADWQIEAATIDRTSHDGRTPSDHAAVTARLGAGGD
jgi:endonuclease/exonuclease/phosphatase family metal-dependent hydrolase